MFIEFVNGSPLLIFCISLVNQTSLTTFQLLYINITKLVMNFAKEEQGNAVLVIYLIVKEVLPVVVY